MSRGWRLGASCRDQKLAAMAASPQPPARRSSYARAAAFGGGVAFAAVFAALLACFAIDAKAAGLLTASSARLFRSSVIPAFFNPLISCPYVSPFSRAAALMRTTHSRRKSRFLRRRPTKAYFSAVSTDSFAARYSLLLLA